MKAFKSLRFLTRKRQAKVRFGLSFHDQSIGVHVGKPSLYVFYRGKPLNQVHLGTF